MLLCEDESIVAIDMQLMIEEFGYHVLGPCARSSEARRVTAEQMPDLAVLDVSLRDGSVFAFADELRDRGVGLVFHSGHMESEALSARFPDAVFCPKPADGATLAAALRQFSVPAC